MSYQAPITIKKAVESIFKREYLLPAIQREFVWDTDQVAMLFDSLMRGYPIGSFLFWKVEKERTNDFQFYDFIGEYNECNAVHNAKVNVSGDEGVIAVLDGQQRLTSLYIALKGSYAYKKGKKKNNQCINRYLYLNINTATNPDSNFKYGFEFLSKDEVAEEGGPLKWFEVSKILDFNGLTDVNSYLRQHKLEQNKYAQDTLCGLYDVLVSKAILSFYLEESQELDKVLNIFIRINSGGTPLGYSDMLLSIATSQWKDRDAREEINSLVDDLNSRGDGFDFDKDLVMKSCLVLNDLDVKFKVDNFNKKNTAHIEKGWAETSKALRLATDVLDGLGYSGEKLAANNAIIPIANYLKTLGNPEKFVLSKKFSADNQLIGQWLALSIAKRVFGGNPDQLFRELRQIIKHNSASGFPLNKIVKHFKGSDKTLVFSADDIEELMFLRYGKQHTFSVLTLLYPTLDYRNKFHIDHIFPRSWFDKKSLRKKGISSDKIEEFMNYKDQIGNLQLLEGLPNEEKSNEDFSKWLNANYKGQKRKDYMKRNYIPENISLRFDNFIDFMDERESLLKKALVRILKIV